MAHYYRTFGIGGDFSDPGACFTWSLTQGNSDTFTFEQISNITYNAIINVFNTGDRGYYFKCDYNEGKNANERLKITASGNRAVFPTQRTTAASPIPQTAYLHYENLCIFSNTIAVFSFNNTWHHVIIEKNIMISLSTYPNSTTFTGGNHDYQYYYILNNIIYYPKKIGFETVFAYEIYQGFHKRYCCYNTIINCELFNTFDLNTDRDACAVNVEANIWHTVLKVRCWDTSLCNNMLANHNIADGDMSAVTEWNITGTNEDQYDIEGDLISINPASDDFATPYPGSYLATFNTDFITMNKRDSSYSLPDLRYDIFGNERPEDGCPGAVTVATVPDTGPPTISITDETMERLLYDQGIVYCDYGLSGERLIGATRGGNKLEIIPEIKKIPIDGSPGDIQKDKRKTGIQVILAVNIIEWSTENIIVNIPGSENSSNSTHDIITCNRNIEPGDYFTNITLLLEKSLVSNPFFVRIDNAMALSGISTELNEKDEAITTIEFTGHFTPFDLNTEPWEIKNPHEIGIGFRTVNYLAGANGSIVGNPIQVIPNGFNSSPVWASADIGYSFIQWSDTSTDNPRTDFSISSDITVTATFA